MTSNKKDKLIELVYDKLDGRYVLSENDVIRLKMRADSGLSDDGHHNYEIDIFINDNDIHNEIHNKIKKFERINDMYIDDFKRGELFDIYAKTEFEFRMKLSNGGIVVMRRILPDEGNGLKFRNTKDTKEGPREDGE